MTFREFAHVLRRRWYVMVGVLLAAAAIVVPLVQQTGVYSSRTTVTFYYPESTPFDRYNGSSDKSVIGFAASVATQVSQERDALPYVDNSAPFYGAGLRQSVAVFLWNSGSQWLPIYDRAQINIEVVGPDRGWVIDQQDGLVNEVLALADSRQTDLAVGSASRVIVSEPLYGGNLTWVGPDKTGLVSAVVTLAIAALIVALWASVIVDRGMARFFSRRSRRRTLRAEALT